MRRPQLWFWTLCLLLIPTSASAQSVVFLDNELTVLPKKVVIRAAFEVTGPAHRWYTIYFHLALARNRYLMQGKKRLVHMWGSVFTPANMRTARWTDIREQFTFKELALTNLPRGQRTRVWAVYNIWDNRARKYVNNGWIKRSELFITTDAAGKVKQVEATPRKSPQTIVQLIGRWKMSFPDGKTTGQCTFTKDGSWSWRVLEGGKREKASDAAGSFKLNNLVLELTPAGEKTRDHPILWHNSKRFTIKIKNRSVHFSKN